MGIGDLVIEKRKLYDQTGTLLKAGVGIIIVDNGFETMLVQWNNGTKMWRHSSVLEVVSESR